MTKRTIDPTESQVPAVVERKNLTQLTERLGDPTAEDMLAQAMTSGMSPESMKDFYALYQTMKADQARQAYTAAMSRFKAVCPAVQRRTQNSYFKRTIVDRSGASRTVPSMYASLEDIGETIRKPLDECGLSYRFDGLKVEGDMVTLSCVVSHVGGHTERSPVTLPYKSNAGCSDQQKMGAAMTYAQRYSLIQALGLTTCEEDDDGNEGAPGEKITAHQADNLDTMLAEFAPERRAKFLLKIGYPAIADIPASKYSEACAMIEAARRAK